MPTLEDVLKDWREESVIDEASLNKELLKTPSLHAKFVEYLVFFKAKLSTAEKTYNVTSWKKRKYFRGEMDKDDLIKHGWSQWQGLKPSSSELNQLLQMDGDMNDLQEKVTYYKTAVSAVEYIMKQIHSRDYMLKTLFEYQKYISG